MSVAGSSLYRDCHIMNRASLQFWPAGFFSWLRFWILSLAVAAACVLLFGVLLAPTAIGQQAINMLRFALGWHHIARHQHQLISSVETAFRTAGRSVQIRRPGRPLPQRRGQEYWQYQTYTVKVPPEAQMEVYETILRRTVQTLPLTILRRQERLSTTHADLVLTIGIAGVPTDTFVFTRSRSWTSTPTSHAQIAIVIDDLGWDLDAAHDLLALEAPLSFAILPDAPYRIRIAQEAQRRGYDVLLHLPMEPVQYPDVDPGHLALLSTMSPNELVTQIGTALDSLPIAIGVNNHMGSRLTENRDAMQTVMQQMKRHHLFFLDSRTTKRSLAYQVAQEMGVPTAQRQVFLDNETDPIKIHQQLNQLAALAYVHGTSIGIGHPYPETIQVLRDALTEIRRNGIDIVPISHLVR